MPERASLKWVVYALLGALFAGVVSVLTKRGLSKIDLTAGLLVQTTTTLCTIAVLFALAQGWKQTSAAPWSAWLILAAAGVSTGLSWFFGYRALQLTDVAKSTPIDKISLPIGVVLAMIFLAERPGVVNWVGIALMFAGAICVAQG